MPCPVRHDDAPRHGVLAHRPQARGAARHGRARPHAHVPRLPVRVRRGPHAREGRRLPQMVGEDPRLLPFDRGHARRAPLQRREQHRPRLRLGGRPPGREPVRCRRDQREGPGRTGRDDPRAIGQGCGQGARQGVRAGGGRPQGEPGRGARTGGGERRIPGGRQAVAHARPGARARRTAHDRGAVEPRPLSGARRVEPGPSGGRVRGHADRFRRHDRVQSVAPVLAGPDPRVQRARGLLHDGRRFGARPGLRPAGRVRGRHGGGRAARLRFAVRRVQTQREGDFHNRGQHGIRQAYPVGYASPGAPAEKVPRGRPRAIARPRGRRHALCARREDLPDSRHEPRRARRHVRDRPVRRAAIHRMRRTPVVRLDMERPPLPRFGQAQSKPQTGEGHRRHLHNPARHGAERARRMAGLRRDLGALQGPARPAEAEKRIELGVSRVEVHRHAPRDAHAQDAHRQDLHRLRSQTAVGMAARPLARQQADRPRGSKAARQGHRRTAGGASGRADRNHGARRHVRPPGRAAHDFEDRPLPLLGRTVRGARLFGDARRRLSRVDRVRKPRRQARMALPGRGNRPHAGQQPRRTGRHHA